MVRLVLVLVMALGVFSSARADEVSVAVIKKFWEWSRHVPRNEQPLSTGELLVRTCDAMRLFDKMPDTCPQEAVNVGQKAQLIDQLIVQLDVAAKARDRSLEQDLLLRIDAQIDQYMIVFDNWYIRHFPKIQDLMKIPEPAPQKKEAPPKGQKT